MIPDQESFEIVSKGQLETLDNVDALEGAIMPDSRINGGGEYVTAQFEPTQSFRVSEAWHLDSFEEPDILLLEGPEGGELLFARPSQVYDQRHPGEFEYHTGHGPENTHPAPESINGWVSWLRSHPYLDTSDPISLVVGGTHGAQMDVTSSPTPEQPRRDYVPLFPAGLGDLEIVTGSAKCCDETKARFFIVDVGNKTVVIVATAPTDKFDEFLPKAQKVLNSVEWLENQ